MTIKAGDTGLVSINGDLNNIKRCYIKRILQDSYKIELEDGSKLIVKAEYFTPKYIPKDLIPNWSIEE